MFDTVSMCVNIDGSYSIEDKIDIKDISPIISLQREYTNWLTNASEYCYNISKLFSSNELVELDIFNIEIQKQTIGLERIING